MLFEHCPRQSENPPGVYTEVAIEQWPGIIAFFENDVPLAFKDARHPRLRSQFQQSNTRVVQDLKSYLAWLKSDLLPRSGGKKLLYDEMVDIPLDKLLEIG